MSVSPEILFHRFFQSELTTPADRQRYRGKQDLDRLEPALRSLLTAIQKGLNEALSNEKRNVPEHVKHDPFHLDYVRSSVPNALAFVYEGYSFIGITMALVNMLWDICDRLSKSEEIARLFGKLPTGEEHDKLLSTFFPTQLTFVVTHEFTHHVHGHLLPRKPDSIFPSEIEEDGRIGDLSAQALEIDADGYATYHVLAHLINGERRPQAVELLGYAKEDTRIQDQALLSSFVTAVGAFLHALPAVAFDGTSIYRLRHPPQAARMNFIMHFAVNWCEQNRPGLAAWMTTERFQMLMNAAAAMVRETNGRNTDWSAQTSFLQSDHGSVYIRNLDQSVKAHISSL